MEIYNSTLICYLAHWLECWTYNQKVVVLNSRQVLIFAVVNTIIIVVVVFSF